VSAEPPSHPDDVPSEPALSLAAYGWDEGWADAWAETLASQDLTAPDSVAPFGSAGSGGSSGPVASVGSVDGGRAVADAVPSIVPGRLVAVDRGEVDVAVEGGLVRAWSSLVDDPDPLRGPCTGDWAALRPRPDGSGSDLVALLPRRSAIVRGVAGRSSHGQVLAANVDTVAVVVSLEDRPTDLGRLERFVAVAWESGAQPVIVLTKSDVVGDGSGSGGDEIAARAAEVAAVAPGVEVVVTSAPTGGGLDAVRVALTGTIALIGPSGAGKSTLANALLGLDRLATGSVREADGKGRHTTVRRELVALPEGGTLIDTPGLRSVGLWDAADGLALVFTDIDALAERCRFRDCAHEREPGCAVRAAVDAGELTQRRLDSFHKLQSENEWEAARADARLEAERDRDARRATTALRRHYRDRRS
jgi:ribosome biogenesis GTPase